MLRNLAVHARQTTRKALAQRVAATTSVAARPNAFYRNISTTRCRFMSEKPAGEGAQQGKPQDALVLTPYEKVQATATGGFWIGLLGLGAAGIYMLIRQLMPNRMSPNGLFSETLDVLSENTMITTRLGTPIHGYGHDQGGHREGRRNRIEHVDLKDKDGNPRLRIKYNIKGPNGHAFVFAEVNHDMAKGEYVYLIVQLTKTGELIKVVDNRQILRAESKEERDALRALLGNE